MNTTVKRGYGSRSMATCNRHLRRDLGTFAGSIIRVRRNSGTVYEPTATCACGKRADWVFLEYEEVPDGD